MCNSPLGTPPGWYPPPQQPGQLQWWNGTSWADSFTLPASQ
ncbi:DUF2510 domain-containing protein [Amycolatopsis sp. AA4]|nr:DUF2510 domain-containing protein [Amycolatopsis sp. AA4]